jgi:GT2 family glycosyltransferase
MGSYGIANEGKLLAYCVYKEIAFRHKYLLPEFPKVFGSYNFCVKKNVFEQVGGFNEFYRHASGEDNDLSYKITSSNLRIYFERKALVDHFHPTSIKKYLKEQFRHGFWRVMMYSKYPSMAMGDGYTFWKDMVEVPWSLGCLLGIFLSPLGLVSCKFVLYFLIVPFLIFEIFFAHAMLYNARKDFFWGFIMFLRSFSRAFGLSTGFFCFLGKKILNKC